MLAQYTYIKPRYQFGKQCSFFPTRNVAEENIWPNPVLMQNYIIRTHCNNQAQVSSQSAAHEAQTIRRIMLNSGVQHDEGGWPKEVNPRDSEVVQRFRRRVEKGDNWTACMRKLITTMEHYVLQNNAVNIHQNFFDDLIPTSMAKEYSIRVTNLYEDPQTKSRPIRHLSWSPNGSNRLAASYSFLEFEDHPVDVSPYSYVWDIENPNKALYTLKSSTPLLTAEFNARDPVVLLSGLISGQVCCWDIRTSDKPVQTSHRYTSHRQPASQTLWIPSKTNTDFFSASTDGMIMWWDSRYLKKPTDTLIVDLDNPSRANFLQAVGITSLQFEPTMSSRFLAGTENGIVLNVNRRGNNPMEKLALRFECCTGPIVAIDRNPVYTKNFLTVGDWCAKVWADDTKEGFFLSSCNRNIDLTGGCWSRARCSVFFTISKDGTLDAYDILAGVKAPLASIRLCSSSLTAICSHEDGELLAVGSRNGNIYLLECSENLTTFTKDERLSLSNYLDRCSRYEKAIDNRLKEIRLIHASSQELPLVRIPESKTKNKKKDGKDKKKDKDKPKKEDKAERGSMTKDRTESRKKSKGTRPKGKSTFKTSSPHLTEVEINYFSMVENEAAKFEPIDEADMEAAQKLLMDKVATKPKEAESDVEKEDLKKMKSIKKLKSKSRTIRAPRKSWEELVEELPEDVDLTAEREKGVKERATKILKKSCLKKVCKPKVCCMDLEERRRSRLLKRKMESPDPEELTPDKSRSFVMENKSFKRLTDYIATIPSPPRAFQRKILAMKSTPPNILRGELEEAKKELREWQEKAIAKKLSTWEVDRKLQERSTRMIEARPEPLYEPRFDTSDTEGATEKCVSLNVDMKEIEESKIIKKTPRPRKSKKMKVTQEDMQKEEEQKQKELWNLLKRRIIKYDDIHKTKQFYPRISAAFVRTSMEYTDEDQNEGNQ